MSPIAADAGITLMTLQLQCRPGQGGDRPGQGELTPGARQGLGHGLCMEGGGDLHADQLPQHVPGLQGPHPVQGQRARHQRRLDLLYQRCSGFAAGYQQSMRIDFRAAMRVGVRLFICMIAWLC